MDIDIRTKLYYSVHNMTKVIQASQVRQEWSTILNTVYKENSQVIVEKSGIPVAAIISPEELKHFNRYKEETRERLKVIEDIRLGFKGVSDEELEQEISKAVTEVRKEMRTENKKILQNRTK